MPRRGTGQKRRAVEAYLDTLDAAQLHAATVSSVVAAMAERGVDISAPFVCQILSDWRWSRPRPARKTRPFDGAAERWREPVPLSFRAWSRNQAWMARAACRRPRVNPDWFTVEETAPGAARQIARAKGICRTCTVGAWCRAYAEVTGEYGVYDGETYTERTRRLQERSA